MPLRYQNGINDTVLREQYTGSAANRICYPGIISCISVTAVMPGGLAGCHITFATSEAMVDSMFQSIKSAGAAAATDIYVLGAIGQYKISTAKELNTRKKLRKKIHSLINANAVVRFYDTSPHAVNTNVLVEKNAGGTDFFLNNANGNPVIGFNYPAFAGLTQLNPANFAIR